MKRDLLNDFLSEQARLFATTNRIADVGDIVETTRAVWKKPRRVRITKIGAMLIADWSEDRGFFLDFEMTYIGQRIRKDGTSTERYPEAGVFLGNLRTADGREWVDRCMSTKNARMFNHTALNWRLDPAALAAQGDDQ